MRKRATNSLRPPTLWLVLIVLVFVFIPFAGIQHALRSLTPGQSVIDAICRKDAVRLDSLLAHGANPNATHLEGSSALSVAVALHDSGCVRVLLAHGASANGPGQFTTPLKEAVGNVLDDQKGTKEWLRDYQILALLLRAGADYKDVPEFSTPAIRQLLRTAGGH